MRNLANFHDKFQNYLVDLDQVVSIESGFELDGVIRYDLVRVSLENGQEAEALKQSMMSHI